VAILGGAKVSDKIEVVRKTYEDRRRHAHGGGMAYTFLKSRRPAIGKSLVEEDKLELARRLREEAASKEIRPSPAVDHLVGAEFKAITATQTLSVSATPDGWMGLDIGPKHRHLSPKLPRPKPLFGMAHGRIRNAAFAQGTLEVAKAVAAAH